jgi:hypothetical protein
MANEERHRLVETNDIEYCNGTYMPFSTFAGFPNTNCNWLSFSFITDVNT